MSNKAKLAGIAPELVVKDVVRTAEYYRDILGFNIMAYFLDPPVYAMVERDGRSADISPEIVKRIYGSREFEIRDCDGHIILVGD